jgi:hypothetical protein
VRASGRRSGCRSHRAAPRVCPPRAAGRRDSGDQAVRDRPQLIDPRRQIVEQPRQLPGISQRALRRIPLEVVRVRFWVSPSALVVASVP